MNSSSNKFNFSEISVFLSTILRAFSISDCENFEINKYILSSFESFSSEDNKLNNKENLMSSNLSNS